MSINLTFNVTYHFQGTQKKAALTWSIQYFVNSSTVDPVPPYSGGKTWFGSHFFEYGMISTSGPKSASTPLMSPCKRGFRATSEITGVLPVFVLIFLFNLWMNVVPLPHLLLLQALCFHIICHFPIEPWSSSTLLEYPQKPPHPIKCCLPASS